MEEHKFVICPACEGTKVSPFIKTRVCACCKGEGVITVQLKNSLSEISKALTAKLNVAYECEHLEYGWCTIKDQDCASALPQDNGDVACELGL